MLFFTDFQKWALHKLSSNKIVEFFLVFCMYPLLAELSAHDLEVAETLIGVIRFLLIFLAARALAEVLVRLSLPTIVGELLAGVVIGASGFHLLIPPSAHTELNQGLVTVSYTHLTLPTILRV